MRFFPIKTQTFLKLLLIFPCLKCPKFFKLAGDLLQCSTPTGSEVKWHVKAVRLRATQHISVSQTDNLMDSLLGALPSADQSPALLSFHFVSLYFSELKSHDQRQASTVTSVTFPPVTPVNHAHCGCKASGETDRVRLIQKAITSWLDGWMTTMGEWFIQQLCRAALSHDLTIPLFTLLPHKVQHKT